jgi:hypothetical protein
LDYENKTIDVLEFGRKYEYYHNLIKPILLENKKVHLFEKNKNRVVFEGRNDFTNALANSKISICFPSSISHPERCEGVSTMTLRYLQSMASKCLIVGVLPDEMLELFGYCPIVNVDLNNPGQQILDILNDYEKYIPLIEKNYEQVKMNHTWANRFESIFEKISDEIN